MLNFLGEKMFRKMTHDMKYFFLFNNVDQIKKNYYICMYMQEAYKVREGLNSGFRLKQKIQF